MRITYVTTPLLVAALCCGIPSCKQATDESKASNTAVGEASFSDKELASEPAFPGGNTAWTKHLAKEIEANMDDLTEENISGTVVVSFTVDTSGQVVNARVESCCESGKKNCVSPDTKLAQVALEAVTKGPHWEPARRVADGRAVKAVKKQPVTFRLEQS